MIDPHDLPEDLKCSPPILSARLEQHRRRLDSHEQRLCQLEQHTHMVQTPVGQFPLHIVLILLFALIAWRPDLAARLIGQ